MARVKIYTNTQKSQFRDLGNGKLQILGIPITVDNAVMNGVFYEKSDNAAGLATYRDQPVTLRHPEDVNGNGVSALSADGLMKHWSGGVIINTYNSNGVNYADTEFKESMMMAQDNGEYYVNRLKSGESIGISTGLWFDGNNESGMNEKGESYHARAINQVGDHVAMLPDEEPPAGGAATFIRFNGENDDQELTINIDEMLLAISEDVSAIIDTVATNNEEKGLLSRFFALCKQAFAKENNDCDNVKDKNDLNTITNKEGDAMRETVENELTAKGIAFNKSDSDAVLLALLNKPAEVAVPSVAINAAVKAAIAPLKQELDSLKTQLTANADKELDVLAKQAAPLMGLEEAEAKLMGANALHKVLAKNGVTIGVDSGTNHKSPEGNKDTLAINKTPWLDGESE